MHNAMSSLQRTVHEYYLALITLFTVNNNYLPLIKLFIVNNNNNNLLNSLIVNDISLTCDKTIKSLLVVFPVHKIHNSFFSTLRNVGVDITIPELQP